VRSAFASAGCIVFMAVSIFPPTGANIDTDIASSAIAIIMPPCARSSEAKVPIAPGTGA
jgi:hypothetical protein